jgi:hypothetical protein
VNRLFARRLLAVVSVAFAATVSASMSAQDGGRLATTAPARAAAPASNAIDTYCATCHNGRTRSSSGPVLDRLDTASMSASPRAWARAYRQLQAGAMPPIGAPRPDRATATAMLASIEHALGATAALAVSDDATIATRLATMLWNSAPDAALLQDATRGTLRDAATLERQVRRMLADDRAHAFVARFFVPWLQLDELAKADPDTKYFPGYDASLRDALARETELFLVSQLRDDRDPLDLWSADYTFLNEQLARHYGAPNVSGAQFRRVSVTTPERAGLLGHGSVLMVTSRHQHGVDAAYTTPATRAKWLRLHFFGAALPNGFPGAQPVKPELPITPQTRTLAAEPCGNCHRNFFPLGYALENFDPIGRWRTHDQVGPVDASGAFVDGTPMNGVVDLRRVLLQHSDAFRTTITEKLLTYAATGSAGVATDSPDTLVRARQILRSVSAPRWSALIAAVARADAP